MIRLLQLTLAVTLFFAVGIVPDNLAATMKTSQEIPKFATVKIILLKAPGVDDEKSWWGIAYQFRIINQANDWQAWKQGKFKAESEERVGELIKEGAAKATLRSAANREFVFHIPLSPEIQERLRNQPKEQVKIKPQMTPEEIRILKEQEAKTQIFLFYPVINIYDAKLKKNILIPASRTWTFADYPQARFEMTVEINEDGSYKAKSSLPSNARPSN